MKRFVRLVGAMALGIASTAAIAQTAAPSPAPGAMEREDLEAEVTQLRAMVAGGAVVANRPAGCTSVQHRQFDFWLGEWDVGRTGVNAISAESTITLHDQGCVIIEHWRPFRSAHGHSINVYDAADQKWHQTWADAGGQRTEYVGGLDDAGVMRFDQLGAAPPGLPEGKRRMNFERVDANTVRQSGERYDEATKSWTSEWSLTYRRRGALP